MVWAIRPKPMIRQTQNVELLWLGFVTINVSYA